jgi:gliding motility-associated-like protein
MSSKLIFLSVFSFLGFYALSQPSNDNPCNAIPLQVNSSCNFNNYMNLGATPTAGVPDPGCAGYAGGDVWFSFTMPENGYHTIVEMGAAGITEGGMAIYSGTDCNSLALVACDDNSGSGNMPLLEVEDGCGFQYAGDTFWVRIWENGNDNNGLFDICAYATSPNTPPGVTACNGNLIAGNACCDAILLGADLDGYCGNTTGYTDVPDEIPGYCAFLENNAWIAFIASSDSTTLEITSFNCLFSNGIQVAILSTNDCNTFTTVSNCWNPTAEGTGIITATNLTIGETYYIMIDGWGGDLCDYVIDIVSGVQTVSVTASDAEICQGQSVQLTVDVLGSGNYSYTWSPTASLDDPNSATPIATPGVSTDYTVTITGIEDSIQTVSVTVFPAAPSQPVINGPDGVCRNSTGLVYFGNTPDATDYFWTTTGSATIVGTNTTDSVIVDFGTTNGSVCLVASNDCGDSPSACFNVNVVVQPDISATDPPATCSGDPFDLTSIVVTNNAGGGGLITYYHNQTDANAGNNPIIPPVVNSSGTYYIRMSTGANCFDITTANVTIEDPQLQVTDPSAKCSPDSTDLSTLTITETNGFPGGSYSFFTDSLDAVNFNSPMVSTMVYSTGIYWVRYTTPNGCFDVAPVNVVIDNTPDITVLQPAPLCPGASIDLDTITLIDANGAVFTKYFFDNQAFAILGNPAFALSNTVVSTPQTYYLRAVTAYNCVQIVGITISATTAPSGSLSGGGTYCPGSDANLVFNLSGNGPFDLVYTDGSNFFPLNNISNGHIETIPVAGDETYSIFSIWDANGCSGTINGSPVNIMESTPPSAMLIGDAEICGAGSVSLVFDLTGAGPFDVTFTDGNDIFTLNGINNGHVETVNVSANSVFTLSSVTDANGCDGTVSGSATITVLAALQFSNFSDNCDPSYNFYTISFEVNGGTLPYTLSGITGSWNGNIFTSDPISAGSSYNFNVSDNSICGDINLSGVQNCLCFTDAGTMDPDQLEACEYNTVTAFHNTGTEFLNAGDLLQFALHNGVASLPWNVYAISNTPTFTMQPGMLTGNTYYISAIAGPDDGFGNVDTTHTCLSVSPATPVVFLEEPEVSIAGDDTICNGTSAFLTFHILAGNAPFDVTISDGADSFTIQDITDGFQYEVFPTVSSNFTITAVTDNSGVTCIGTATGNAQIDVVEAPVASQLTFQCNATNTAYQVVFEVVGGDPSSYTVSGDPGVFDDVSNSFTSEWMASGSGYYFEIDDLNACGPTQVTGNFVCNCTTDAGTMSPAILTICEDEVAQAAHDPGSMNFDGNDVLGFVLHDAAGTTLGNVFLSNNTPEFNYDPSLDFGVIYYISAVVANDDGNGFPVLDPAMDPCMSVAPGQPVVFSQTPVASIIGDNSICQGDTTAIIFNITGTGPFDLEYLEGGVNAVQLSAISDGHLQYISPDQTTDIEIISVAMTNSPACNGLIDVVNNSVVISVTETPVINNFEVNCSTVSNEFVVSFEIAGGNASNYSIIGNSGTLNGNLFTSDPMPGGTTYYFQVDDGSGCLSQPIIDVEFCNCTPDIAPSISLVESISCFGDNDGILSVTNINGEPPYNFVWSNMVSGTNNAGLNAGWYSVTMTDANNCISVDSFLLTEPDPLQAILVIQEPGCFGEDNGSITFENVTGGSGNYTYSLDVPASFTGNIFHGLPAGSYEATIVDAEGCSWSGEAIINDPPTATLDLGDDHLVGLGDSVRVIPKITGSFLDFNWFPETVISCDTCLNQTFAPTETTTYFLTLTDDRGCEVSESVTIIISTERPVYVPTAFSPNGDGFNDFFKVYCGSATEQINTFKVFNRWGALVYEINDVDPNVDEFGWDGTFKGDFLENGVFIYYVEITFRDGKTTLFKGDVTLLR